MKYIDIHTHSHYQNDEVMIVQNLFPNNSSELKNDVYYSVGLHPWYVNQKELNNDIRLVQEIALNNRVIAVGEAGLDKSADIIPELQKQAFEMQIEIAENIAKPLIIHCVKSYSELLHYRKISNMNIPWIFHWFNSSPQTAAGLIEKNCYLSFGHMLFNETSKAVASFLSSSLNNVFFETDDAGYSIADIYSKAASLKKINVDDLKIIICENFKTCFGEF